MECLVAWSLAPGNKDMTLVARWEYGFNENAMCQFIKGVEYHGWC